MHHNRVGTGAAVCLDITPGSILRRRAALGDMYAEGVRAQAVREATYTFYKHQRGWLP